ARLVLRHAGRRLVARRQAREGRRERHSRRDRALAGPGSEEGHGSDGQGVLCAGGRGSREQVRLIDQSVQGGGVRRAPTCAACSNHRQPSRSRTRSLAIPRRTREATEMTDVGAPLAELFTIQKGRRPSTVLGAPAAGARRLLQINDLRGDGPPLFSTDEQAVCAGPGDVLMAWDGADAGTVGYGLEGNVGSTLAVLRPATDRTYTPYVGRFLQAQFGRLNASAHGAAVPHVSRRVLETLEVPLPPLAEQRRIAAVLEKADAIRWKRRES